MAEAFAMMQPLASASCIKLQLRPGLHDVDLLTAATGEAGLGTAWATRPGLILLDLQLPDVMGDVVLKHLRGDERTRDIPVVMLSADATPANIERLLEMGAHAYLTKPLKIG